MLPEVTDILAQPGVVNQPFIEAWRTAEKCPRREQQQGCRWQNGNKNSHYTQRQCKHSDYGQKNFHARKGNKSRRNSNQATKNCYICT